MIEVSYILHVRQFKVTIQYSKFHFHTTVVLTVMMYLLIQHHSSETVLTGNCCHCRVTFYSHTYTIHLVLVAYNLDLQPEFLISAYMYMYIAHHWPKELLIWQSTFLSLCEMPVIYDH